MSQRTLLWVALGLMAAGLLLGGVGLVTGSGASPVEFQQPNGPQGQSGPGGRLGPGEPEGRQGGGFLPRRPGGGPNPGAGIWRRIPGPAPTPSPKPSPSPTA